MTLRSLIFVIFTALALPLTQAQLCSNCPSSTCTSQALSLTASQSATVSIPSSGILTWSVSSTNQDYVDVVTTTSSGSTVSALTYAPNGSVAGRNTFIANGQCVYRSGSVTQGSKITIYCYNLVQSCALTVYTSLLGTTVIPSPTPSPSPLPSPSPSKFASSGSVSSSCSYKGQWVFTGYTQEVSCNYNPNRPDSYSMDLTYYVSSFNEHDEYLSATITTPYFTRTSQFTYNGKRCEKIYTTYQNTLELCLEASDISSPSEWATMSFNVTGSVNYAAHASVPRPSGFPFAFLIIGIGGLLVVVAIVVSIVLGVVMFKRKAKNAKNGQNTLQVGETSPLLAEQATSEPTV